MLRLLNLWRLRTCEQDEFTIEYYITLFRRHRKVVEVIVHDFVDPVEMLWPAGR